MSERLHYGRLAATVAEVVDSGFDLLPNFELAAVPVLEGAERPAEWPNIRRRLRGEGVRVKTHRGVLLLEPGELERLSELGFFNGNDELFLCHEWNDEFEGFPGRISSDVQHFNEGTPLGLEEWMIDCGCMLAIGDGDGLNYATLDRGLAESLSGYFQIAKT